MRATEPSLRPRICDLYLQSVLGRPLVHKIWHAHTQEQNTALLLYSPVATLDTCLQPSDVFVFLGFPFHTLSCKYMDNDGNTFFDTKLQYARSYFVSHHVIILQLCCYSYALITVQLGFRVQQTNSKRSRILLFVISIVSHRGVQGGYKQDRYDMALPCETAYPHVGAAHHGDGVRQAGHAHIAVKSHSNFHRDPPRFLTPLNPTSAGGFTGRRSKAVKTKPDSTASRSSGNQNPKINRK